MSTNLNAEVKTCARLLCHLSQSLSLDRHSFYIYIIVISFSILFFLLGFLSLFWDRVSLFWNSIRFRTCIFLPSLASQVLEFIQKPMVPHPCIPVLSSTFLFYISASSVCPSPGIEEKLSSGWGMFTVAYPTGDSCRIWACSFVLY